MSRSTSIQPGQQTWVRRDKWPDVPHYGTHGVFLGEDEHGRWVGEIPDHPVYRGDEILFVAKEPVVVCVPHDDWYLAHWIGLDQLYVDIATPPTWTGDGARSVDLDFDILVKNGSVDLLDEDEFEAHRVKYGYPAELEAGARQAATQVLARVRAQEPPFTLAHGAVWHDRLTALSAQP